MVQQNNVCKGSVALGSGCINCQRCEDEILAALPGIRQALKDARDSGDRYEEGRQEQKLTTYELALRKMSG